MSTTNNIINNVWQFAASMVMFIMVEGCLNAQTHMFAPDEQVKQMNCPMWIMPFTAKRWVIWHQQQPHRWHVTWWLGRLSQTSFAPHNFQCLLVDASMTFDHHRWRWGELLRTSTHYRHCCSLVNDSPLPAAPAAISTAHPSVALNCCPAECILQSIQHSCSTQAALIQTHFALALILVADIMHD